MAPITTRIPAIVPNAARDWVSRSKAHPKCLNSRRRERNRIILLRRNVPGGPLVAATVPNYMTQAILVTLFCCIPLGIVGIVKANEVNKRLAANDYPGALAASNSARQILMWGVGVGLVVTVGWIIANINSFTGH